MINKSIETLLTAFHLTRAAVYFSEYRALNWFTGLLPGTKKPRSPQFNISLARTLQHDILHLFKKDARLFSDQSIPIENFDFEKPSEHLLKLTKVFFDGIGLYRRRGSGRTTVFKKESEKILYDLPRYFRRNFHFQTDGYLSKGSAEIYDHQVDLLFAGTTDCMRRSIIKPLIEYVKSLPSGGPIRVLEVASGTGRVAQYIKAALPAIHLTLSDLSGPYIRYARTLLKDLERINFIEADATQLPFKDNEFDAVFSVFLFHELPLEERKKVIFESKRVLKTNGFFGWVDSIQENDFKPYNHFIETFPNNFHEPFFNNYIKNPMETLVFDVFQKKPQIDRAFFSKVGWLSK